MNRRLAFLLALAGVAACDPRKPIAEDEVSIRVVAGAEEVELGKSFPLTVVRVWSSDLEPEPWRDQNLAPLAVRPDRTTREEDGRHVEETRVFRAYAFDPGAVTVKSLSFQASPKLGGPASITTCDGFTVRVKPALDPKAPGPPELFGEIAPEPRRWWLWVAVGVAILAAFAHLVRTSRQTAAQHPGPTAPPILPHERALDRIRRLRGQDPHSHDGVQAWHVEASSIVRDYVAEQFAIRALEMTTEELLSSPATVAALPPAQRALLFEVLGSCDLVKFGRHPSTAPERERLLTAAETFVRGPAGPPASAGLGGPHQQVPAQAGGPSGPTTTPS